MTRTAFCLLLLMLLCTSCAQKGGRAREAAPPSKGHADSLEGFVTSGFGQTFFRPCGSTRIYRAGGDPEAVGELELEYEEIQQGEYGELYARLAGGIVADPGENKNTNNTGTISVDELLDIHKVKDGDCAGSGVGVVAREDDSYVVRIEFPLMENKALEMKAADLVAEAVGRLKETAGAPSPEEMRYRVDVRYDTFFRNDRYAGLRFVTSFDTGGAHPVQTIECRNYDMKEGREITAADVFREDADYAARISGEAVAALSAELEDKEGLDWIYQGAGPKAENFKCFTLSEKGLTFHFPPYSVAPYAEGIKEVSVPFDRIRDLLKPPFTEW